MSTKLEIITVAAGTLSPTRNAGSLVRGTLNANRYDSGTLAGARNAGSLVRGTILAARLHLLPSIPGTIGIASKTSGTIPASRVASSVGTLAGARNAGSIVRGTLGASRYAGGTLAGARNAGSLVRGTLNIPQTPLLTSIPGTLGVVAKTSGTIPASRVASSVGTLASARNAGSLVRGTIGVARLQLLPSIPGTIGIVSKTSGTLPNARIPRSLTMGTLTAWQQAGSLNRGTVPSGRAPSLASGYIGTLPTGRVPTGTFTSENTSVQRAGTLYVRTSMQSGTVPATRISSGTFGVSRIPTGTFASENTSVQRAGTLYVRTSMQSGTVPAVRVSSGTLSANRTQPLQSIPGTLPALKLVTGTFPSENVSMQKAGTLLVRTNMTGGTVPAARIRSGTIAGIRTWQSLGTHLAGSVGQVKVRYGKWPNPFANANYAVALVGQVRATGTANAPRVYQWGILRKVTGSVRYYIASATGTVDPLGTLFITGFAS